MTLSLVVLSYTTNHFRNTSVDLLVWRCSDPVLYPSQHPCVTQSLRSTCQWFYCSDINCMLLFTPSHMLLRHRKTFSKNVKNMQKKVKRNTKTGCMSRNTHTLTSSMRWVSWPMLSGRALSLLLLALRTRRGRPHTHTGNTDSWLRLSITETMGKSVKISISQTKNHFVSLCFSLLRCLGSKKKLFSLMFKVARWIKCVINGNRVFWN